MKLSILSLISDTVIVIMLLGGTANADSIGKDFFWGTVGDADKTHEGTDSIGQFTGIAIDETWRCWQATFADILFGLGLSSDASATYLQNFSRWANVTTSSDEQKALFDQYFQDKALPYYATAYNDLADVSFSFAAQELLDGQGVKLGVGDSGGPYHAITFWGWNDNSDTSQGLSWLVDSDADYFKADAYLWQNSVDSDGHWQLILKDGTSVVKEYTVWNIVTVCYVPEPSTILLLSTGLVGVFLTISNRFRGQAH